ncbi:MAG TPA: hypothetical protein VFC96_05995 [Anaerovoracaceae bacterium]|jgi:hypothetical protein|nr:hypothetical protein [Anaerovoracaceae bacterium]
MGNIFIPTQLPQDWQRLLADPLKHWRKGYSARAMAYCWQEAEGFPISFIKAFSNSGLETFQELSLLFAFPEWKVHLPGGKAASQNDIFLIGKCQEGLMAMMVEGKVSEPFDKTVSQWLQGASPGKKERLDYLVNLLRIDKAEIGHIRYQLLHRTASALIEAARLGATNAAMLIHSFSETYEWYDDFANFVALFNLSAAKDSVVGPAKVGEIDLYFGWVRGDKKYLSK